MGEKIQTRKGQTVFLNIAPCILTEFVGIGLHFFQWQIQGGGGGKGHVPPVLSKCKKI